MNIENLLQEYEKLAIAWGESLGSGNHIRTNDLYHKVTLALEKIRAADGEKFLYSYLEHTNQAVKSWTAHHVIKFDHEKGEAALREIADGPPTLIGLMTKLELSEINKKQNEH